MEKQGSMGKKVFISHASADQKLVSLFVDQILVAGSGVKLDEIIYTSRVDTGVHNGKDIPATIKEGIKECCLFVMMVSDHYRNSEVCLNEMGAAWMRNDLTRLILLLPGVEFERIGWLMSLNKGTKLTESEGLDQIHDQIVEEIGAHIQTATWNRIKACFLDQIKAEETGSAEVTTVPSVAGEHEEDEEMDILDMREGFDTNTKAYSDVLLHFSTALTVYSEKIKQLTKKLNQLHNNPQSLTPAQVRGVFIVAARAADELTALYERETPELRYYFDKSIEYAILLQQGAVEDEVKNENKKQFRDLVDSMISARDEMKGFRNTLDDTGDLDKNFKKSQKRLKAAIENMLEVMSFCISRASALL